MTDPVTHATTAPVTRPVSAIDQLSDQVGEDLASLNPMLSTLMGWPGFDHRLDDLGPDGFERRHDFLRSARSRVEAAVAQDTGEQLARDVLVERLDAWLGDHDSGWALAPVNVMESPVQLVRQVFDVMTTNTADERDQMQQRLLAVPDALAGYRQSLELALDRGLPPAARQVRRCVTQSRTYAGSGSGTGFFSTDLTERLGDTDEVWTRAAAAADAAYGELADFLEREIGPRASTADAVGEQRYRLGVRQHLGVEIDVTQTYAWGWAEFLRLRQELTEVATAIAPGRTPAEAAAVLDEQPRYQLRGIDAFQDWMQELSDRCLAELGRTSFEVPEPLRALNCRVAPAGGGLGAYYIGPNDDFSRPGTMWFSLDRAKQVHPSWRDTSTVFHEGVPGHHLQVAVAVLRRDRLNSFQRMWAITSGHCEGWALYAERLMRELGYFADEGDLLGHLNSQLFRAARVVLDIGMHLQLPIPSGTGFREGERWTPEIGLEFLSTCTLLPVDEARDEIDRYLGWPGQAIAYKVGERIWRDGREEARKRHGAAFDAKGFHSAALDLGNMGLGPLTAALGRL